MMDLQCKALLDVDNDWHRIRSRIVNSQNEGHRHRGRSHGSVDFSTRRCWSMVATSFLSALKNMASLLPSSSPGVTAKPKHCIILETLDICSCGCLKWTLVPYFGQTRIPRCRTDDKNPRTWLSVILVFSFWPRIFCIWGSQWFCWVASACISFASTQPPLAYDTAWGIWPYLATMHFFCWWLRNIKKTFSFHYFYQIYPFGNDSHDTICTQECLEFEQIQ